VQDGDGSSSGQVYYFSEHVVSLDGTHLPRYSLYSRSSATSLAFFALTANINAERAYGNGDNLTGALVLACGILSVATNVLSTLLIAHRLWYVTILSPDTINLTNQIPLGPRARSGILACVVDGPRRKGSCL